MSLAFLLQPHCLGMPLTLYMDLHPDDWDRAQVTGEVPVGKEGYVRLSTVKHWLALLCVVEAMRNYCMILL